MANYILKNDNILLRCANWAMEVFFENFNAIVQETNLKDQHKMQELLFELDQNMQGRGMVYIEISDFFGSGDQKLPIQQFYDLVCKTVERIKSQKSIDENYVALLEDFKEKILR